MRDILLLYLGLFGLTLIVMAAFRLLSVAMDVPDEDDYSPD